jgi:hypothetical protein
MVYNVLVMKNYYITNIDWDTTDSVEEMDVIELPTEVLIQAEDEDSIADALSDEYGFCVNSFDYDILGIKTIRRLVKEGILYFDFSADAEEDKKWLEEHGDTYTEDYSYNKVEEIVSISDDDFARREFPRKSHDGCLIFNAENVDYMITKCNKIVITGTNTFKIKDNGYRPGDYWNMAIRKDFV